MISHRIFENKDGGKCIVKKSFSTECEVSIKMKDDSGTFYDIREWKIIFFNIKAIL